MTDILDTISSLNPKDLFQIFFDNGYYEVLFPFLLIFALLYTILPYVGIFRSKKTGRPYKAAIFVISLFISFYAVGFEISEGYTMGKFMMMLFPNISSLTIAILAFYIIAAITGKDLFGGMFEKKYSSYLFMFMGAFALGAIIYFLGIVAGFWDFNYSGENTYLNFIFALIILILGIVFLLIGMFPIAVVFLFVFGTYVYNGGSGGIFSYFLDPFVFIISIIMLLISWISGISSKEKLIKSLNKGEKTLEKFEKQYGRKPRDYEDKIHDIVDSNYKNKLKKWNEKYENENYK